MMYELNYIICDGKKTAPTLTIPDASHYVFFAPKDSSADSLLLKQMEDGALEKILELYTQTPKQVFITLDIVWGDSYAIQLQQIVEVVD